MKLSRSVRRLLAHRRLAPARRLVTGGGAVIWLLHRFGDGPGRLGLSDLATILARLEAEGCQFCSLVDILRMRAKFERVRERLVAFTVDDGYWDFELAAPVFERFGCPVTVFVTTGLIDGTTWMWWDKIQFCMTSSGGGSFQLETRHRPLQIRWGASAEDAHSAASRLAGQLEFLPPERRCDELSRLADETGSEIPESPPTEWTGMSWALLRELEERGVDIGPHTITHPVLSLLDSQRSRREITQSWARVQSELSQPLPVFAYPNGSTAAFSQREVDIARDAGLHGGVTVQRWYAIPDHRGRVSDPYRVPRFPLRADLDSIVITCSGLKQFRGAPREI